MNLCLYPAQILIDLFLQDPCYNVLVQLLIRNRMCYGSAFRFYCSDLFETLLVPLAVALSVHAMDSATVLLRIGSLCVLEQCKRLTVTHFVMDQKLQRHRYKLRLVRRLCCSIIWQIFVFQIRRFLFLVFPGHRCAVPKDKDFCLSRPSLRLYMLNLEDCL